MVGPGFSTEPYPGLPPLPPPVEYPERKRGLPSWAWVAGAAVVLVGLALAIALTNKGSDPIGGGGSGSQVAESTLQRAIQDHLDALASNDAKKIARNAGCGLFDAMKDQSQELSLARMAGQGFIKDYGKATITSIDKTVWLSDRQAHVLYSLKTEKGTQGTPQGQAEVLVDGADLYVCSNYLRTAAQV